MTPTVEEIQDWIVRRVSGMAGVEAEEIDVRQSVRDHGLDSVAQARLVFGLEQWLGVRFQSSPLDEDPAIEELARHLAQQAAKCK